jgi:hypothetical protein
MSDVSFTDIEAATAELRKIAAEKAIGVCFDAGVNSFERLGDAPTLVAYLIEHEGRLTACTASPAATPNVIEPLMHEMAHAVLEDHDDLEGDDRPACFLVIEWAERLPEVFEEIVTVEVHKVLKGYED